MTKKTAFVYDKSPEVIFDMVDGAMTLCETRRVEFFRLNETGSLIWSACGPNATSAELTERLAEVYVEESWDSLHSAVTDFLNQLASNGLLKRSRRGASD
jgi:Coenzyme PQQ synthesis protein D (PqqD)